VSDGTGSDDDGCHSQYDSVVAEKNRRIKQLEQDLSMARAMNRQPEILGEITELRKRIDALTLGLGDIKRMIANTSDKRQSGWW
jgi:predicted  nucleic acid-binding Zn-ribbon protein